MYNFSDDNRKYKIRTYPLAMVGYVLFMLFVLFLYIYFQSRMILIFMCVLTLMPFVSVACALFMRPFVDIRITGNSGNTRVGDKNLWRIELKNDSIFTSLNCEVKGKTENTFMGTGKPLIIDMPLSAKGTEPTNTFRLSLGIASPNGFLLCSRPRCGNRSLIMNCGSSGSSG